VLHRDSIGIQLPNISESPSKLDVPSKQISFNNVQALRLLPPNINFSLSDITVTPYMPVPETNGEEWDRLEPASALDALVELTIHGEYNGQDGAKRSREGLDLRTSAAAVFEVFFFSDFWVSFSYVLP
jgi:hypothetical protein